VQIIPNCVYNLSACFHGPTLCLALSTSNVMQLFLSSNHLFIKDVHAITIFVLLLLCILGTCEASRFEFESDVSIRFESDVGHTCRHVCHHTTNYTRSQFNKNINIFAVCRDLCLQLHCKCSCTAVARAHTQLPHDNRIGIEHVNDYPLIRFEIRFDQKFLIRRSLMYSVPDCYCYSTLDNLSLKFT